MPTVPENTPSSTTTSNGVDCEPDDDWKEILRKRIEEGLQSMVADAKENHATELSKAPDTTEARIRLEADYKDAMQTIKSLASEQYKLELDRERNQRRWTAGVPMAPDWSQYFRQEQQNIMNSIKQSNQTDNSVRTTSESPTEERSSVIFKPRNEPPALAPTITTPVPVPLPVPPSLSDRPAEECGKSFVSPHSIRRGSDVCSSLSADRDDPGSFRRNHHASVHIRPSLPDNWEATETADEHEELLRSPSPRARVSFIDGPSQPSSVSPDIRWDSSLSRSNGSISSAEPRSPPRAPLHEVWKPAISPAEDVLPLPPAEPYNLGRRGSTTSMRSTGSGASIRPSITETIRERAYDDGPDESDIEENDYGRFHETVEQVRPWISTTTTTTDRSRTPPPEVWKPAISPAEDDLPRPPDAKPYNLGRRGSATSMRSTGSGASIRPSITETIPERADNDGSDESDIEENDYGRVRETIEQVKPWISTTADRSRNKPHLRRNSRQSSVDADLGSSSLRSDDRHRPIDSPRKRPFYDYRDQSSPRDSYASHRDHQPPPPQDPRPIPVTTRSSYGGDDRDYGTQYSTTPHGPHGPKPPPYFPQRESRPISRQVSFTRQLHPDLDDDNDERGIIDRERYRDRDRDRDRDGGGRGIHSAAAADTRHSSTTTATYPYSASSRHSSSPSYPNNPSTTPGGGGSSRPVALQDYDVHEDWEGGPGPRYNNYRGLPPPPPENLEYQRRPESARPGPGGLSRQSSYVRPPPPPRDDPDGRYSGGNNDGYSSSSRHFSTTTTGGGGGVGGIPIPPHTQSHDEQQPLSQQQLAWREWAAEGNRHYHQQQSPPPPPPPPLNVVESSFPPPPRFAAAPPTATHPLPPSQQLYSDDEEDDVDDVDEAREAAKRREQGSRRQEVRWEGFRRELEEKRLQNESQHLDEMFIDLDPSIVDSKLMDEQLKLLQQAGFRRRMDDIRRAREERKRNDSIGNDSAWPNPSHPDVWKSATSPTEDALFPPPPKLYNLGRRGSATSMRSAGSFPQREFRPISRQVSFTRQLHLYLDEDNGEGDIDRRGGDRDQEDYWDRDYDRDRDLDGGGREIHSATDPRHSTTATYPDSASSRHSSYPNNPSKLGGSSIPASLQVYDVHEDWEGVLGPSLKRKLEVEEVKCKADGAAEWIEEPRRRELAGLESLLREHREERLQSHFYFKLMDEILQQVEFRKRQRNCQSILERNAGPSTSGWDAGSAPAWGSPSTNLIATASFPSSSTSTSTWKPRTEFVSSGTYPTSSSPHTAPLSNSERARKQQEFVESQQEQFRRAQEKLEVERQPKSAGRQRKRLLDIFKCSWKGTRQ